MNPIIQSANPLDFLPRILRAGIVYKDDLERLAHALDSLDKPTMQLGQSRLASVHWYDY